MLVFLHVKVDYSLHPKIYSGRTAGAATVDLLTLLTLKEGICFGDSFSYYGGSAADHLYSPINHHLVNLLPLLTVTIRPHLWVECLKGHSSNIDAAPDRHYEKQTGV